MENTFKVGDVVVLNSGGPDMTIEHVNITSSKGKSVNCVWFDDKQRKVGQFLVETIKLVGNTYESI